MSLHLYILTHYELFDEFSLFALDRELFQTQREDPIQVEFLNSDVRLTFSWYTLSRPPLNGGRKLVAFFLSTSIILLQYSLEKWASLQRITLSNKRNTWNDKTSLFSSIISSKGSSTTLLKFFITLPDGTKTNRVLSTWFTWISTFSLDILI